MKKQPNALFIVYVVTITALSLSFNALVEPWEYLKRVVENRYRGVAIADTREVKSSTGGEPVTVTTEPSKCADAAVLQITCPPYEALPDDDGDDSRAFQTAINALPLSGGTIAIPAGTYVFDKPINIQKAVNLVGVGPRTILTHRRDLGTDGAANFIRIGGADTLTANVTISNLSLQGPEGKDVRTPTIRVVSNVEGVTIRDVLFKNVSSSCVLVSGRNVTKVQIYSNRANEFYEQFVELGSGGMSAIRIERNIVKSTRGHPKLGSTEPFGIAFEPARSGEISDVSILGNDISFDGMSKSELINTGGVSLSTGTARSTPYLYRRILVQDNIIRTVGVGIRVQTLRSGTVSEPGSVVITRNRIEDAASHGIQVRPASDDAHRDAVSITENTVRGYGAQVHNRYDGIRLEGSAVGPEIRGNQILSLAGKPGHGRYGISIEPGIKNPVLRDNNVAGYMSGAILNNGTSY